MTTAGAPGAVPGREGRHPTAGAPGAVPGREGRHPREPALPGGRLDQAGVLELYRSTGGLRTGHFVLSSGRHSDTYLQSALVLQWPRVAEALGRALAEPYQGKVDVVVGPALGGVVIGHEVARALGARMVFTERVRGAASLRRSFEIAPGARVLLAEDVVTTGGSALEVGGLLARSGAVLVALAAVVDRLPASSQLPVPFTALARVEAGAWEAAVCPACLAGAAVESPGSRHLGSHRQ